MTNVMSMKSIRNKPHRSAFDLSHRKLFTAKVGELLPVYFKEVLPGDKFRIGLQSFTRTQPVNSAAFTRIKEYYDYFFVPYRLLWRYFDQFITQTESTNPQFADSITSPVFGSAGHHPYFIANEIISYLNFGLNDEQNNDQTSISYHSFSNEFGYGRAGLTYKLLKYLGYGLFNANTDPKKPIDNPYPTRFSIGFDENNLGDIAINPFPLLAYQKICQDYYRNQQWDKANPTLYNVDYLSGNDTKIPVRSLYSDKTWLRKNRTMFDLNYCTWNRDLFTGVMPSPQYGEVAKVDAPQPGVLDGVLTFDGTDRITISSANVTKQLPQPSVVTGSNLETFFNYQGNYRTEKINGVLDKQDLGASLSVTSTDVSKFSVLALRQAEAMQKWREISISGKLDYKAQIEKHFGISVPAVRSNLSLWLGGTSSNMDISEVVNTNLADMETSDQTKANIAGKGVGVIGHKENFQAKEHGIMMCIYHAVPLMDYADDVTDPYMLKTSQFDYAIPEFDSIGMQSLPGIVLNPYFGRTFKKPVLNNVANPGDYFASYNSLGYVPRYVDYKTSIDVVTGAFSRSLKYWAAPMSYQYFKDLALDGQLKPSFFKVNPAILNTIFAVNADYKMSSDQLLINSFHDIKVVRNLDYNGLPY